MAQLAQINSTSCTWIILHCYFQSEKEVISPQEGENMCREMEAVFYGECSAKTGEGVNELFTDIANWFFANDQSRIKKARKTCGIL